MARMRKQIIIDYRMKFLNITSSKEMEKLRNQFYLLPFSENTLDVYWERIATGEKEKPKKLGCGIDSNELYADYKSRGCTKTELAINRGVSIDTIRKYLNKILKKDEGSEINV